MGKVVISLDLVDHDAGNPFQFLWYGGNVIDLKPLSEPTCTSVCTSV